VPPEVTATPRVTIGLALLGVALVACCATIAGLSRDFTYGTEMAERPILLFVALLMLAAVPYFGAVYLAPRASLTPKLAWGIFIIGVAMRLVMAIAQPILEDDFYRYLWDGAVTAHGHNPYTIRPADARAGGEGVSPGLLALAQESGIVLQRVNHPELGTIYPPVAQAVFTIAHGLAPWSRAGLLTLYYAADCAAFALLLALLRRLGRNPALVLVYWWNPLCVKEIYNSLHMDILLVPCLLLFLWMLLRGRPHIASCALAVATAVKLWPILLLAPMLVALRKSSRALVISLCTFLLLSALLLAPMAATRMLGDASGVAAYSARWEMNDALFMVFPWSVKHIAAAMGHTLTAGEAHRGGKVIAGVLLLAAIALICRRAANRESADNGSVPPVIIASLWTIAALFLLSPTQFPWYFTWFAPLLALVPSRGLLLLTFTLPLYYLKFYLDARGQVQLFHHGVVWLEFVPVWLLLLWDWERGRGHIAE
jgi:alpha-1,6-mannosyltransferase